MRRRGFLKLAAVALIHPALRWVQPLSVHEIPDIEIPWRWTLVQYRINEVELLPEPISVCVRNESLSDFLAHVVKHYDLSHPKWDDNYGIKGTLHVD
jgi:hypothetical protein